MQYNKTAKYSIVVKLDQQIGSWWSRNPKICSLACQSFLQKAIHTVKENAKMHNATFIHNIFPKCILLLLIGGSFKPPHVKSFA